MKYNSIKIIALFIATFLTSTLSANECVSTEISMDTTISASWDANCSSTHREGKYAKFYTFTLTEEKDIAINLTSQKDTYMYLLSDTNQSGTVLESDDDGGEGTNSKIAMILAAGTYTIEATTYSSENIGDFSISLGETIVVQRHFSGEVKLPTYVIDLLSDCNESTCPLISVSVEKGYSSYSADVDYNETSNKYEYNYNYNITDNTSSALRSSFKVSIRVYDPVNDNSQWFYYDFGTDNKIGNTDGNASSNDSITLDSDVNKLNLSPEDKNITLNIDLSGVTKVERHFSGEVKLPTYVTDLLDDCNNSDCPSIEVYLDSEHFGHSTYVEYNETSNTYVYSTSFAEYLTSAIEETDYGIMIEIYDDSYQYIRYDFGTDHKIGNTDGNASASDSITLDYDVNKLNLLPEDENIVLDIDLSAMIKVERHFSGEVSLPTSITDLLDDCNNTDCPSIYVTVQPSSSYHHSAHVDYNATSEKYEYDTSFTEYLISATEDVSYGVRISVYNGSNGDEIFYYDFGTDNKIGNSDGNVDSKDALTLQKNDDVNDLNLSSSEENIILNIDLASIKTLHGKALLPEWAESVSLAFYNDEYSKEVQYNSNASEALYGIVFDESVQENIENDGLSLDVIVHGTVSDCRTSYSFGADNAVGGTDENEDHIESNPSIAEHLSLDFANPIPFVTVDLTACIEDITAPVITLLGDNPQTLEMGSTYVELNATTDDGSLIIIDSSAVDMNTVGEYNVTYNAIDASTNQAVEVTRTVIVEDTTAPVITLNGVNPQTLEMGSAYIELGANTDDGSQITIDITNVDMSTAGEYTVTYSAMDSSGNQAAEVTRKVIVENTDMDGDGIPDSTDDDIDGDGYTNTVDDFPLNKNEWLDTDNDGTGNNADRDDDNDGISDADEIKWHFDPLDASDGGNADADNDGVSNADEIEAGSDPLDPDDTKKPKRFVPIMMDDITIMIPKPQ